MPREQGVQHGMVLKRHCRERTTVVFVLIGAHSHLACTSLAPHLCPEALAAVSYDTWSKDQLVI